MQAGDVHATHNGASMHVMGCSTIQHQTSEAIDAKQHLVYDKGSAA